MKPLLFCLMILFFASPTFSQTQLDPCAVVQNPEKYSNSVIVLKGIIHSSFEEFSIIGPDCDNMGVLKIWLAYPKDDSSLDSETIKFKPSSASKKLDKLLKKRSKCGEARVSATLRGIFQYRKETLVHYSDGSQAIVGFGHQGMYSYRLLILSIESAEGLPCRTGGTPQ